VRFAKLHGAGNDFLMLEGQEERDWELLSRAMCDRRFGAGADGVMLVLPSKRAAVRMRLFNADGSEAEVSGNGIRCLVKYVIERGLARPAGGKLTVEAAHDVLEADVTMEGSRVAGVRLSMGRPRLQPAEIPVAAEVQAPVLDLPVEVNGAVLRLACLSMGNPHAVQFIDGPVDQFPLAALGPKVEHHPLFPARVNYGVARVLDGGSMELRVWERGVGETLACGTGSCAAAVAGRLKGLTGSRVDVRQPGGVLTVEWAGEGEVFLSGGAEFVYEGDWPDTAAGSLEV
jgi:diaminopimelate epimerase